MNSLRPILPMLLSLAAAANASAQIINGSFELPLIPVGTYTNFPGGSTLITGWTVVGVDSSITSTTYTQSGITFQAQSGNQWLDLAGIGSNSPTSGVTQSIATTVGQAYEVSFYVGSARDGVFFYPSTVDLSINGGTRVNCFNPAAPTTMLDWKLFTVPFTATSSSTSLTFLNGSASYNYLSGLDNVSVRIVPEPSTLLVAVGALTVGFFRRLRNRRRSITA